MLFDIPAQWEVGPIEGTTRRIGPRVVSFKRLALIERFDLGLLFVEKVKDTDLSFDKFLTQEFCSLLDMLVAQSDADDDFFDDLTLQIPVALTALEINVGSLFAAPARMHVGESRHRAIRKLMRKPAEPDALKIAPKIQRYWFLYRPVVSNLCSYRDMFIDQVFDFPDIHDMHEMLDLMQFNEITANHMED